MVVAILHLFGRFKKMPLRGSSFSTMKELQKDIGEPRFGGTGSKSFFFVKLTRIIWLVKLDFHCISFIVAKAVDNIDE